MKVLVTGASGQLGSEVVAELRRRRDEPIAADMADFDLTDPAMVSAYLRETKPNAVIHCAAYTAVDKAETEPALCSAVNAGGTLNIVRACLETDAKLLYVSTDYVFAGEGEAPHSVNDQKNPRNVYGLSKLQGEEAIRSLMKRYFIVRTSWVYGANGQNFVKTIRRIAREKKEIRVVCDQVGSPTYAPDLAALLVAMVHSNKYGIYHATGEGECSWADFAGAIIRESGLKCRVRRVTSAEYRTLARRPLNSRLSKDSLDEAGFPRLPAWEDGLNRMLAELETKEKDTGIDTSRAQ